MILRVEGLDQAVCWSRHARNSQFSLKILPLCTIASNIKSILWSSLHCFGLVFVFNCSIVFCRNRSKFCFVCELFFHSQTSCYLPGFLWGDQQIVAPDWSWYISIVYYLITFFHSLRKIYLNFFCRIFPDFCTVFTKICTALSQSVSRNFSMYIIIFHNKHHLL